LTYGCRLSVIIGVSSSVGRLVPDIRANNHHV
jgi:hypothetical protein